MMRVYKTTEAQRRQMREYYLRNRKSRIDYAKRWKQVNHERAKEWGRKAIARRRKENPERERELKRRQKYGLEPKDYEALLKAQDYRCGICGGTAEVLAVDHDHLTGEVRGLLCRNCNLGVGFLKDSTTLLAAAINYLNKER